MTNRSITVSNRRDFIREVIVTWEGRVRGWHGTVDFDGGQGYGCLGFRYGWFDRLKQHYSELSGEPVSSLTVHRLTEVAETYVMLQAQNDVANAYLQQAFDLSIGPRNLNTLIAQLLVCDIDINNGLGNNILWRAGINAGLGGKEPLQGSDQELKWMRAVIAERNLEIGHMFSKYPGLEVRYDWYESLMGVRAADLDLRAGARIEIPARAFSVVYKPPAL